MSSVFLAFAGATLAAMTGGPVGVTFHADESDTTGTDLTWRKLNVHGKNPHDVSLSGQAHFCEFPDYLDAPSHSYFQVDPFAAGGSFTLTCGRGQGECKTAYAKREREGADCFRDHPDVLEGHNRWGWTNRVRRGDGDLSMPVWAGAGGCTGGKHVGDAKVRFQSGGVEVEFVPISGVEADEVHFYVGKEKFPVSKEGKSTVAPSKYPFKQEEKPITLKHFFEMSENEMDGDLYVIAHVVACADGEEHDSLVATSSSSEEEEGGEGGHSGGAGGCPCTFYIVAYHCPPCSKEINGGWSGLFRDGEWEARNCGPKFTVDAATDEPAYCHPTVVYRRFVPKGESVRTMATTTYTKYLGIFAVRCDMNEDWCPKNTNEGPNMPFTHECMTHCGDHDLQM